MMLKAQIFRGACFICKFNMAAPIVRTHCFCGQLKLAKYFISEWQTKSTLLSTRRFFASKSSGKIDLGLERCQSTHEVLGREWDMPRLLSQTLILRSELMPLKSWLSPRFYFWWDAPDAKMAGENCFCPPDTPTDWRSSSERRTSGSELWLSPGSGVVSMVQLTGRGTWSWKGSSPTVASENLARPQMLEGLKISRLISNPFRCFTVAWLRLFIPMEPNQIRNVSESVHCRNTLGGALGWTFFSVSLFYEARDL